MSSITIKELDATSGGGRATALDVVFVPGFPGAKVDEANFPGKFIPTLCSTIQEFTTYFGTGPSKIVVGKDDSQNDITEDDKSYVYAQNIISLGLPVLYMSVTDAVPKATELSVANFNTQIGSALDSTKKSLGLDLSDKGEHQFKYLTSGGYANVLLGDKSEDNSIASAMAKLASTRGDCVALIDHPDNPSVKLSGDTSYFEGLKKFASGSSTTAHYCAAFTPWININYGREDKTANQCISMPPSYGYLTALATSIKTNASWLAVAGAARGQVPNLYSNEPLHLDSTNRLTNYIAETLYQARDKVSINAITNIKPFGYRIWGNRTLKDNASEGNLTATSFLNIRNMISDVKKVVYDACKKYTFEQYNDVLWLNFKAYIEPTLDKMKTGAGLSGYKIIQQPTTEKAKLVATIKLYPLYAVEDFEISVEMLDDEVKVS